MCVSQPPVVCFAAVRLSCSHVVLADKRCAFVLQVLTIEEPRTRWKEETRTKWETVTERVPRLVHETTEDEIIVTKTRNGSPEHKAVWVRFPFSFHQQLVAWASSAVYTRGYHLLTRHVCHSMRRKLRPGQSTRKSRAVYHAPCRVRTARYCSAYPAVSMTSYCNTPRLAG